MISGSGFWSAAVRAAAVLGDKRRPLITTAEVGYEGLFATRTDDVKARLLDNTALPVSDLVDDPDSRGWYFKLGIGGYLEPDTMLSASLGMSLHDGGIESHRAAVELRFLFGG